MADAFDDWFASSLGPPERLPDRRFVSAVQAHIALDEQLALEDRALIARLVSQLAALVAVAAALWLVGRAAPVAERLAESPSIGMLILLAAFGFVVVVFSTGGRSPDAAIGMD